MRELYAGRQVLFTLDSEFETKSLLEKVVRYLAVEHSKRKIAQREARKAQEAADQEVLLKQREYLVAASTYMSSSLKRYGAQRVAAAGELSAAARLTYTDPQRHQYLRYVHEVHARVQQFSLATEQLLGAPMLERTSATAGEGGGGSHSPSPDASPARSAATHGGGGGGGSSHGASPRPRLSPRFEPRIDLQMSPRTWQRQQAGGGAGGGPPPAPPGGAIPPLPHSSIGAVRGVYNVPVAPGLLRPGSPGSPRSPRSPRAGAILPPVPPS